MRAHVVLLMLWMPPAAASDARVEELPSVDSLLSRAQASLGAPSPRGLRILYLGTGDATAAYQGQDWRKPESRRYQSTLIFDFETQRAALRTEQTRSDGTVSLFRNRVTRDEGTNVNLISGLAFPMSAESAQQTWAGLAWQVPHFALRQLAAERDHLRVVGRRRIDGRILVAAEFTSAGATSFTVTFDDATGALAGYEYTQPYLFGPTLHRFAFKPYRDVPGVGRFPAGYVHSIGGRAYRDVDVYDVRASPETTEHSWLTQNPEQKREASTSKPAETTLQEISSGVWWLKRIGSYNALVVDTGSCVAVVDAPARFAPLTPIPVAPPAG